jgi:hypothetical protein
LERVRQEHDDCVDPLASQPDGRGTAHDDVVAWTLPRALSMPQDPKGGERVFG